MSSSERRARARAGYAVLDVEVHLSTTAATLFAEGLLAERDLENREAIKEAMAKSWRTHCRLGRVLKDKSAKATTKPLSPPTYKTPKGIRYVKGYRGFLQKGISGPLKFIPARKWTEADRAEFDEWCRRWQGNGKTKKNWPTVEGWQREKEKALLEGRTPHPRKRGGCPNGRNPGLLDSATVRNSRGVVIGKYESKPLPRKSDKKIRPLKSKELDRRAKAAGYKKPSDSSPHFVQLDEGELDRKLDARRRAHAKKKPPAKDIFRDDRDDIESVQPVATLKTL